MDVKRCSVVYLDGRVLASRLVEDGGELATGSVPGEDHELLHNISVLGSTFNNVFVCNSGAVFLDKLAEMNDVAPPATAHPVFALVDIGPDGFKTVDSLANLSNSQLLAILCDDLEARRCSHRGPIVPIAVLRGAAALDQGSVAGYLDAGVMDVLVSPLSSAQLTSFGVHAHRAYRAVQKERTKFLATRGARQSWVGGALDDRLPYSYLREAMVSKLLKRICNPEEVVDNLPAQKSQISPMSEQLIIRAVGRWSFSAHDFSDDELVFAGCVMLQHALAMPELEKWRIPFASLHEFVSSSRAAYNSFVLYHNFRHAIDVLQSTFCLLLSIGVLPPYGNEPQTPNSLSSILTPLDALTLLITSIGHDVGHPGVNNFFLVKLNAPLAQLYNDTSVLEAFHCAAFSQILRRCWPVAFHDVAMRKLMISSILATDMGLHFKFMDSMGALAQYFRDSDGCVDGWTTQQVDGYRTLLCALIIKCADISNVARPWQVAEKWTDILQREFHNQGLMEREIGMDTALAGGPPEMGNIVKLAKGQMTFMSLLAMPLFDGMADLLPGMVYAADEIRKNRSVWADVVAREEAAAVAHPAIAAHVTPAAAPGTPATPALPSHTPPAATPVLPSLRTPDISPKPLPSLADTPVSPIPTRGHNPVDGGPSDANRDRRGSDAPRSTNPRDSGLSSSVTSTSRTSDTFNQCMQDSSTQMNTMTPISCTTEASSLSAGGFDTTDEEREHTQDCRVQSQCLCRDGSMSPSSLCGSIVDAPGAQGAGDAPRPAQVSVDRPIPVDVIVSPPKPEHIQPPTMREEPPSKQLSPTKPEAVARSRSRSPGLDRSRSSRFLASLMDRKFGRSRSPSGTDYRPRTSLGRYVSDSVGPCTHLHPLSSSPTLSPTQPHPDLISPAPTAVPVSSPPSKQATVWSSQAVADGHEQDDDENGYANGGCNGMMKNGMMRSLPRRRSRLRLAFWRRARTLPPHPGTRVVSEEY